MHNPRFRRQRQAYYHEFEASQGVPGQHVLQSETLIQKKIMLLYPHSENVDSKVATSFENINQQNFKLIVCNESYIEVTFDSQTKNNINKYCAY